MRREHHIAITRSARYFSTGEPQPDVRELWIVCHGYGQLAGRFIRHFESIASPSRLVVAPEALSRFYVEVPGKTHAETHVGASWMTREDRLSDIEDYVGYLDTLLHHLHFQLDRAPVRVTALGFSQGVATVCRWLEKTEEQDIHVDRAILWGGLIPDDVDLASASLRTAKMIVVAGIADEHAKPAMLAQQDARLTANGIPFERISFNGSHRIDREVLVRLTGESETPR